MKYFLGVSVLSWTLGNALGTWGIRSTDRTDLWLAWIAGLIGGLVALVLWLKDFKRIDDAGHKAISEVDENDSD